MECYEKARDIFEIFRFKEAQVDCLLGIGAIYRDRGHYKKAFGCLERSLDSQESIGKCHCSLASFNIATEKYEKSIKHAEKGLEIFRLITDLKSEKSCLAIIGEAYRCLGRVRKAVAFQNKAPQITQRIGDKRGEARCHNNLGKSCHFLGCNDESITHYRKALEISQAIGMRREEGISVGNLGG